MLRIRSASASSSRLPKNCTANSTNSARRPAGRERQRDQDAHREQRLGGGEQQLDALLGVDRQAVRGARGDREHDRDRAHQQRPLVDLARQQRPERVGRLEPPREQARDDQLGRLAGQRRHPLHEDERVDAQLLAGLHQPLGEVLRAGQDDQRGDEEQQAERDPRAGRVASPPTHADVPCRSGSSAGAFDSRHAYAQKIATRTAASTRVSVCRSGSVSEYSVAMPRKTTSAESARGICTQPRVGGRAVAAAVAPRVPDGERRDGHHQRPPDADQHPVGAGHVRQRQRARGRAALVRRAGPLGGVDLPGLPAEDEVDGVLGQHREQRQHRQRQPGADVDLRGLGGPRQDERRPDDRDPVDERGQRRGELGVGETEVGGGAEVGPGKGRGEGDRKLRREAPGRRLTWSPGRIPPAFSRGNRYAG